MMGLIGDIFKGIINTISEKDAEIREKSYKYMKIYSERQLFQKYNMAMRNNDLMEAVSLHCALKNLGYDSD